MMTKVENRVMIKKSKRKVALVGYVHVQAQFCRLCPVPRSIPKTMQILPPNSQNHANPTLAGAHPKPLGAPSKCIGTPSRTPHAQVTVMSEKTLAGNFWVLAQIRGFHPFPYLVLKHVNPTS